MGAEGRRGPIPIPPAPTRFFLGAIVADARPDRTTYRSEREPTRHYSAHRSRPAGGDEVDQDKEGGPAQRDPEGLRVERVEAHQARVTADQQHAQRQPKLGGGPRRGETSDGAGRGKGRAALGSARGWQRALSVRAAARTCQNTEHGGCGGQVSSAGDHMSVMRKPPARATYAPCPMNGREFLAHGCSTIQSGRMGRADDADASAAPTTAWPRAMAAAAALVDPSADVDCGRLS